MDARTSTLRRDVAQRRLQRVTVHWGSEVRKHMALVPLFDGGYKVLGLVGLDSEVPPTWYPGVPLVVDPPRIVFRSSMWEFPPGWDEVPEGMLEHCYYLDHWNAVRPLVAQQPGAPHMGEAINLAGGRIRGRRVEDVVYEPPLHRVRAVVLRGRWGRRETVSILRLPALAECLEPARLEPLDVEALGPPPDRPDSWMERILRVLVGPVVPKVGRKVRGPGL